MDYAPYWSPAVVVFAVLTVLVVPYLGLIVVLIALLAAGTAVVAGAARLIATAPNLRPVRRRGRSSASGSDLDADPPHDRYLDHE